MDSGMLENAIKEHRTYRDAAVGQFEAVERALRCIVPELGPGVTRVRAVDFPVASVLIAFHSGGKLAIDAEEDRVILCFKPSPGVDWTRGSLGSDKGKRVLEMAKQASQRDT